MFRWRMTGEGVVDNLGRQLEKALRYAPRSGSIRSCRDKYADAARFVAFTARTFKVKNIRNLQQKHFDAYILHLKNQGCSKQRLANVASRLRWVYRHIPNLRNPLPDDARRHNRALGIGSGKSGRTGEKPDRTRLDAEVSKMVVRHYTSR